MKKLVSTVAALALAGAMATSAFAAPSGYTADQLHRIADKHAGLASTYGVDINGVHSAIDALADPAAVDVPAIEAAINEARAVVDDKTSSAADVTKALTTAGEKIEAATGAQNNVELKLDMVDVNEEGKVTVKGTVTVAGAPAFEAETVVEAEDAPAENGTTGGTSTGTSNSGVIKPTGLNTAGVAVAGLAVASVMGVAAVKARKGE